jgi:2-haloacid dehalogenase
MRRIPDGTGTSLIFDLGGVVVDWNPRYLFDELIRDVRERDYFLTEVCSSEWNSTLDRGVPTAQAVRRRCAEFPDWAPYIQAYVEQWPRMLGELIPGMGELLGALDRRRVPMYALTNWSEETFPHALRRYPALGVFRDILVSGSVRLIKPERAIYELALSRFAVDAERCLFIDDKLANVRGAREVGMQAVLFTGAAGLREHPAIAEQLDR